MDYYSVFCLCVIFISGCSSQQRVTCYFCFGVPKADQCYLYTQTCYGVCYDRVTRFANNSDTEYVMYNKGCSTTCKTEVKNNTETGYSYDHYCCNTTRCNDRYMTPRSQNVWAVVGITTGIVIVLILLTLVLAWLCSDTGICWKKVSGRTSRNRSRRSSYSHSVSHTNQSFDLSEIPLPMAPPYAIQDSHPPPCYDDIITGTIPPATSTPERPPGYVSVVELSSATTVNEDVPSPTENQSET